MLTLIVLCVCQIVRTLVRACFMYYPGHFIIWFLDFSKHMIHILKSKRKRKKDQVVLKSAHVNCKVLDTVHNNLTIVITFLYLKDMFASYLLTVNLPSGARLSGWTTFLMVRYLFKEERLTNSDRNKNRYEFSSFNLFVIFWNRR